MHERNDRRFKAALIVLCALIAAAFCAAILFSTPSTASAQPVYSYDAFHSEFTINSDGSVLVRDKVTYKFQDPSGWVGLIIPSSFGTVTEGRVLSGSGDPLPEDAWDFEQDDTGYTLWCNTTDVGTTATFIYEYLIYGALIQEGDRVGLEWNAVPAEHGSTIAESSVVLDFPGEVDTSQVSLEVSSDNYDGQISKRFVGNSKAIIEASWLGENSSYSFSCYWPASLMDTSGAGFATSPVKSWDFERFDADIQVNPDSSLTVRETQVVNFHGSFSFLNRDLSTEPPLFDEGRTYGRVRIHDISVYDLDGQPYDPGRWSTDSYDGGTRVHIEFEAQDEQLGWVIAYRMTGEVIFAADYDRLYWDTVSLQRDVPIKSSMTTAHLPGGADMGAVKTTQYVDIDNPPATYDSGVEGDVLWWRVEDIPPYSTFSIDVALPKGLVSKPWQFGRTCGIAVIAASSVIIVAVFFFMLGLWWKRGRDVGRTGTTMVRYEAPQGLTPAMVGMLMNEKPRVRDISATIVDLARRGYLTIIEEEKRSLIRIKKYAFQRMNDDLSGLLPYEREIMKGLFADGERVSEDDLTNKFYVHVNSILDKGIKKEVMKAHLFVEDPQKLQHRYLTLGILATVVSLAVLFLLPIWFDLGWFVTLILSFIPVGVLVAFVGWFMPARSKKGSRAYEHVLGFKEYMETAEAGELEYMTPENFQANLPYAMVLDVADSWSRKFQDIYTTPPEWYHSTSPTFSTYEFSSSLDHMAGSMSSTLTSSPSSSGSGGGGFGGGSSGGGGGGGGSSAG